MRPGGTGETEGRWGVVVPSCRPAQLKAFEEAWKGLFERHNVDVFVVRDAPPWENVPGFVPRRTDMIRSWGFYKAFESGVDWVLSLDDDVRPNVDLFKTYRAAFERQWPCSPYLSVGAFTDTRLEMRGFPYQGRGGECVVQYGGWDGAADLDAATQLHEQPRVCRFRRAAVPVPRGVPVTTCAMNFAFKREWAPVMWQFPLFDGRYNRFGDIWSGLVQKRVVDAARKVMVVNGHATVFHERASDVFANLEREAPGMGVNERVWGALGIPPVDSDIVGLFRRYTDDLHRFFKVFDLAYAEHYRFCRDGWLSLFN